MALVLQKNLGADTEFAVWKIEEDDSFYLQKLLLSEAEHLHIQGIRHPAQKSRWLASRYLLKHLMNTNAFVELLADENGKPYIRNFPLQVSISHSDSYAAVIISENNNIGIDVEETSRNIKVLQSKFLSPAELNTLQPEIRNKQLLLYWAAKEVMYKMYALRKLEFKDDMYVHPFQLHTAGSLNGILTKNNLFYTYHLQYILHKDYVLVTGMENMGG